MQPLTAPPRDALTADQVTALLLSDVLEVDFGVELLDSSLQVVEDITDDVAGGTISRQMNADIHGACDLTISRALNWGKDLLRPYMLLSSAGVSARWDVGVYALVTPDRPLGQSVETYDVQGYDRLYLLKRQIGDVYAVTATTDVLTALRQVFTDAGLSNVLIDGTASGKLVPTDMVWPLGSVQQVSASVLNAPFSLTQPATWLDVVNKLLGLVNYRPVWCDWDGNFRCDPFVDPLSRPREFTFDATSANAVVGQDRTFSQDQWKIPNEWVFVQQNRLTDPSDGDGVYRVTNQSDGLSSIDQRGLPFPDVIEIDAVDQATLVALGDRRVASNKAIPATLTVTTGPFPAAWHEDVFTYADPVLRSMGVQATQWSYDLAGGDVSWTWRKIT